MLYIILIASLPLPHTHTLSLSLSLSHTHTHTNYTRAHPTLPQTLNNIQCLCPPPPPNTHTLKHTHTQETVTDQQLTDSNCTLHEKEKRKEKGGEKKEQLNASSTVYNYTKRSAAGLSNLTVYEVCRKFSFMLMFHRCLRDLAMAACRSFQSICGPQPPAPVGKQTMDAHRLAARRESCGYCASHQPC